MTISAFTRRGHVVALGSSALVLSIFLAGCTGTASPKPTSTSTASVQPSVLAQLLKSGIELGQSGKYDDAVATFNNILVIDPGNKYAYFNLGVIADLQGRQDQALVYYDKALKTDPSFTPALFNKAIIVESSDKVQATSIYQNIVAIDPKAATAYLRLSFLLDVQGKQDDAKTAREKAIALDGSLATVENPYLAATPTPTPTPTATR